MNPTFLPASPTPVPTPSPRPRRPRRDAAFWRPVIERLTASGLSVAAFGEREALPASAIYYWRRRLDPDVHVGARVRTAPAPDAAPRVIRLDPIPAAPVAAAAAVPIADPVTAILPNGARVTADARHLAALVGALASC